MRPIDADALLSNYKGNILTAQTDYAQGARDIMDDIRNAPTVDAVPVVRCKDCVYARPFNAIWQLPKRDTLICTIDLLNDGTEVTENDFCSWGRINETN